LSRWGFFRAANIDKYFYLEAMKIPEIQAFLPTFQATKIRLRQVKDHTRPDSMGYGPE
jgi:hypothetical protein